MWSKKGDTKMIKKKIALLVATSLLTMASIASAANKAETISITPVVGAYLFDGKQHLEANDMYGVRVGYNFTKAFGIEGLFDYSHNNKSTNHNVNAGISMFRYGGELLYHFIPDNAFVPYIAAGYNGVKFDGDSDGITNKGYKQTKSAFDYGVGAKFFVSENVAIRGDVRHIIYKYDRTYSNFESTLGVYFAFGGAAPVAKPVEAEPAPVVEPVEAPVAAPVAVVPVDSDGDGVIDALDKCSNTPAGIAVDMDGCPLDADNDGVADYLDKCPNTPTGVAVGTDGCPLDADNDGVADYLDRCPATPAGVRVNADGCPEAAVKAAAERFCSKPAVLAINFDTNKADIKAKYYDELKTLGDFLMYFPKAKGEISGHADATGGAAFNLELSQKRADSVKKYLVDTFNVDTDRITTKGYGESKPVASNKTKAGRAKNRRMEANFTCGE
jgi:OmpA-OmpF porin, OOP family